MNRGTIKKTSSAFVLARLSETLGEVCIVPSTRSTVRLPGTRTRSLLVKRRILGLWRVQHEILYQGPVDEYVLSTRREMTQKKTGNASRESEQVEGWIPVVTLYEVSIWRIREQFGERSLRESPL
jgi:hypothetical protein